MNLPDESRNARKHSPLISLHGRGGRTTNISTLELNVDENRGRRYLTRRQCVGSASALT